MTERTSHDEETIQRRPDDCETIQLLIGDDGCRTTVRDLLTDRYELTTDRSVSDADLVVVEADRFATYESELRRRARRPAFCPVVVIRCDPRADAMSLPDPHTSDDPILVDAVLRTPLDSATFRRRLQSLLVRRRQSLALRNRQSASAQRDGDRHRVDRSGSQHGRVDSSDDPDGSPSGSVPAVTDGAGDDRYESIFNRTYQFTGLLEPDGTVIEANDAALEFGGIDRDAVIGTPIWEAYWFRRSESLQRQTKADVERAAGGEFVRRKIEVQGADETAIIDFSIRPVRDEQGTVTLLVPEGRDITELDDRRRELQRSERRFEAVFEDPKMLAALLDPDGTVRRVNRTAMTYVESDHAAIRGEPFWETPWWDDGAREDLRRWIDRAANGEYVEYEREHAGKEADTFTVVGTIRPVTNDEDDVVSLIASAHDITERKRRERELERTNDQLERFASIVSHDLRNPLNVLAGSLEMAAETGDAEQFDHCRDAIDRMDGLIEDLLALARQGEHVDSLAAVDLQRLAADCWRTVETNAGSLRFDGSVTIHADEGRARQLLENLFRNAIEHGPTNPDSQTRQDATEHGDDEITVTVGGLDDGFYVEDDGRGIPPDERQRVFDNGYSTTSTGTGFGLAIVETIAEAHGWELRLVESAAGGARFEFTDATEID
ncbi:sensor histidine kinase [Natrinema longum]|uniref:histidine kinase n=1 Tax=Natrinema longum TaxID=370324 RepID=A0A8A2U386_9EURY|nr:PAS domain-containing sensor histidine kinase [Natrinema longum]MBZ6495005.1 PAS domain-containing sensor histidine kinase [Natrinema longum]QSW83700.1 PAS domain-containing sensor histidine kinase [Natrinema longum]